MSHSVIKRSSSAGMSFFQGLFTCVARKDHGVQSWHLRPLNQLLMLPSPEVLQGDISIKASIFIDATHAAVLSSWATHQEQGGFCKAHCNVAGQT